MPDSSLVAGLRAGLLVGKGKFYLKKAGLLGGNPKLAPPVPEGHAQKEQIPMADTATGTRTNNVKGAFRGSGGSV